MPITFEHVNYIYGSGTPYEHQALTDVNLTFRDGKITAIIGQTGSGKSTLVQHLNALLLPSSGRIIIHDFVIEAGAKPKGLKKLRGKVGLVFQFPEYQLFEETVLKDVSFGPKNFAVSEEESVKRAKKALRLVGLSEEYEERSPLELSGGQKRRVAIAGILAMEPEILILDEPTAGLDPAGTIQMMDLFKRINREYGTTILIVTHDMELVYSYCDDVAVIEKGTLKAHLPVPEFFRDSSRCEALNILPPYLIQARDALRSAGFDISDEINDISSLAECVARQVKRHG